MTRKIVHLSTVHRTHDNRVFNKECRLLVERGFDVTLVIRAEVDEPSPVPVSALPTPKSRLERLTKTQVLAWRRLSDLKADLVHIHDPELIPMAWLWTRLHRAMLVFDAHEDLVKQISTKPYLKPWQRVLARAYARLLTRWADKGADGFVAATPDIAAGFANRNTVVVHNYPWLSEFDVAVDRVPGRVVYAGDLSEERKLSLMIEAAHLVRGEVPDAHLILAGKTAGGGAKEKLREVDGDVVRYVGLLPPAEVPGLVAQAEVGLILLEPLPNYTTSLPTKLFEYMAAGVPFVASNFPAWVEKFGPLEAGVFVDSESAEVVAEAVVGLLASSRVGGQRTRGRRRGFRFRIRGRNVDRLPVAMDPPLTLPRGSNGAAIGGALNRRGCASDRGRPRPHSRKLSPAAQEPLS